MDIDGWILMDGWMDIDGWMDGYRWMDINGWISMDEWMDIDGWISMDGWMDVPFYLLGTLQLCQDRPPQSQVACKLTPIAPPFLLPRNHEKPSKCLKIMRFSHCPEIMKNRQSV
jgi:hypothetical protein